MTRVVLGAMLVAAAMVAGGCRTQPGKPATGATTPSVSRLPAYVDVAKAYNSHLEWIDRLYASTTLRVWYPDKDGEEASDQVEGQLNVDLPDRVALTFTKVGELYAILGCDPEQFWWIELGEAKRARVGRHAGATTDELRDAGLPVHPLDLAELLALVRLPEGEGGVGVGDGPRIAGGPDGAIVVTTPARTGWRRLTLDPKTFEPRGVELLDRARKVVLTSTIDSMQPVLLRGAPTEPAASPTIPRRVMVSVDGGRVRARLTIYSPESGGSRPKPAVFVMQEWLKRYGVAEIIPFEANEARP
ncbi:MAG: hypothetical protein ACKVW3_04135 [Phycisphaerales bacterium]